MSSHELRTPLTALQATLENLQDGVIRESPEVLATMHGHVERLGRLVHDLLELSRLEAGESPLSLEPVELAELIEEVADEARANHDNARVQVSVAPADLVVSADPVRLRQVLGNLVDNSLRHGGRNVTISARHEDASARIEVADDGPGIPEAERERVFERFYRLDHARSTSGAGFGLGLRSSAGSSRCTADGCTPRPTPLTVAGWSWNCRIDHFEATHRQVRERLRGFEGFYTTGRRVPPQRER